MHRVSRNLFLPLHNPSWEQRHCLIALVLLNNILPKANPHNTKVCDANEFGNTKPSYIIVHQYVSSRGKQNGERISVTFSRV